MKYIKGIDRKQMVLFPERIDEYIVDDNPVQFVDVFVDRLDLNEVGFKHTELADTGRPPYNLGDLLKLYVYGYLNRIRSSRWLEKECKRNVELIWLLKKLAPDFKTIAVVRKEVLAWQKFRNNKNAKVNWQFTTEDARIKLSRLYPTLES